MDTDEALAGRLEQHYIRLRALAYWMLGSLGDVDDAGRGMAPAERR